MRESVDMAQKSGLLKARRSPYLHRLKMVFSIVCSMVCSAIFWYFQIFSGTSGIEFSTDHRMNYFLDLRGRTFLRNVLNNGVFPKGLEAADELDI